MKRLIKFGSIEQFSKIARDISHHAKFIGVDENKKPIYNHSILEPKLEVIGSEKIHGTNLTVCFNNYDGIWYQSKERIITPNNDHAKAAAFCEKRKDVLIGLIQKLSLEHRIDLNTHTIVLSGEFAGGGIYKKSALSGVEENQFLLFQHFKVATLEHSDDLADTYWKETKFENIFIDSPLNNIYNVMNFPKYVIEIDFQNPRLFHETMQEELDKIELNSPVGKFFGKENNFAEGIVFTTTFKDQVFKWKVKGEKHSKSKVRKLPKVDNVKEQLIIDIAQKVTPAWRLEQMFDLANDTINGGIPDPKNIPVFLKLVFQDIVKEEQDVFSENNLNINNVNGKINQIIRGWYLEQLESLK